MPDQTCHCCFCVDTVVKAAVTLVAKKKVVDGSRPGQGGFDQFASAHLKVAQAVRPRWEPTFRLEPIPPCVGQTCGCGADCGGGEEFDTGVILGNNNICLLDRSCRGRWNWQVGKSKQEKEASHCLLLLLLVRHLAYQGLENSNWTK